MTKERRAAGKGVARDPGRNYTQFANYAEMMKLIFNQPRVSNRWIVKLMTFTLQQVLDSVLDYKKVV